MAQQSLTQDQLVSVLKRAGWEDELIPWALEVTKRESGWSPSAFNDTPSTGDLSYGLFQINMLDEPGYKLGAERRARWGIRNEDLHDPVINARVARDLLDIQGPKAWSVTHGNAIQFPGIDHRAGYQKPKVFNSGMTIETQGVPGAAYGATNNNDVSVGDLSGVFGATFPGGNLSTNKGDPRFAASDAVISSFNSLFGKEEKPEVITSQLPQQTTATTADEGQQPWQIVEYLTGDRDHSGYRADHGGANYHEHLGFQTTAGRDRAIQALENEGIQIGSLNDGKHAETSLHYADLAFDVPASQVPVGQEPLLSAKVRRILRMA